MESVPECQLLALLSTVISFSLEKTEIKMAIFEVFPPLSSLLRNSLRIQCEDGQLTCVRGNSHLKDSRGFFKTLLPLTERERKKVHFVMTSQAMSTEETEF